ncbi:trypco2 family protein [Streptomyces bobili]|uniref:trypco2 family protein n=1 Tax=Streptomyces bobili TaxID=67280 RepID=UPI0033A38134
MSHHPNDVHPPADTPPTSEDDQALLGADQQFTFGIEEAELELQLELRTSGKGDGKVSFGVATVGAGGELSTVRTHRLTLKLSVRDRARGGSSPEISDTETGSWDEE